MHWWKGSRNIKTDIPENLLKEKEPNCFRQSRHKELCNDVRGGIMFCQDYEQTISTTDIVNQSLKRWKDAVIWGTRITGRIPSFHFHQLGWTWLHTHFHITWMEAVHWNQIHFGEITAFTKHCWSMSEEHSASHSASYFKNGCECRFFLTHSCHLLLHTYMRTKTTTT